MVNKLVFRNDDVCSSTDIFSLVKMYSILKEEFPTCEILSCVTLFSEINKKGSVYEDVPFKDKETKWFYKARNFIEPSQYKKLLSLSKLASHGLYHVDHSKLPYEAQEMSIAGSCSFLQTKLFVPPFNRYNQITEDVCFDNNIILIKKDKWKSLEVEPFNCDHKFWFFHSWRYTPESFRKVFNGNNLCLKS